MPRYTTYKHWDEVEPVHSLLFVKSIPTIRLEDSKPAFARAAVTCGQIILINHQEDENFANHLAIKTF